ncbi:OsmC family protein [Flavobacterium sp. NKUCC04_CG]|uniref:OsmC family protein n=1 Tax=Flavobacterium sp. NKUCC04_CG TaxID=2842121 RepID=UPI001C5BE727|nr:OsmC family protein [Flavobacterium sp. NKUCC04_CG]MBW3520455.1 OsmC family protein [Flavobacterium sp. NKUCC04_CG]
MNEILALTSKQAYKTIVTKDQHAIIVDEPVNLGGQDLGMTPKDLLAGALASCTSITIRMYIDRKGWDLGDIRVRVSLEKDAELQKDVFKRVLEFDQPLEADMQKKVLMIADKCPVHKMLEQSSVIATKII